MQFVKDVLHVVDCQDALKPQELRTTQGDRAAHQDHQVWCEKTWSHVLPTLEYWALELRQLKVVTFIIHLDFPLFQLLSSFSLCSVSLFHGH